MGKLYIECLERKIKVRKLAKAVYKTLGQKARIKAEVVFESEDGIRSLNRDERGIDVPTDVLSFPTLDGIKGRLLLKEECGTELDGGYIFIGSIVLCDEKIKEQAQEIGHSEERERNYLIVHGLLHLFGYDHIKEKDKKEMREKENEIIALLYPEETEEQGEKN
ncbi:MAG: rRNA maturation RNase YbeY [Clostridia bacterium]|nr:rRNA maturation RNase YbeY [Clostridia bacterium]